MIILDERYAHLRPDFPSAYDIQVAPVLTGDLGGLERRGADARAIVTAGNLPLPESLWDLPNLGLVALIGSGFEGVDVDLLNARGIALTFGPGMNADDVATHAAALFLGHNRLLLDNDRRVRDGVFRDRVANSVIRSVAGLKIGVMGLGRIGRGIARRLAGFDCEIAWWGPRPKPEEPLPRHDSLVGLAAWCDVLFVAARADSSNDGLVNAEVIKAVGPQGLIVNISRGSIIDEDALIAALRYGRLGGTALDVFAQEPTPGERWRDVPRALLSPHTGATGDLSRRAMALGAAENLRRLLAKERLLNPVPGSLGALPEHGPRGHCQPKVTGR